MSGTPGPNFRSLFLPSDNESKRSAFQRLAVSLRGSFCRKQQFLPCERDSPTRKNSTARLWMAPVAPSLPQPPSPAQRNALPRKHDPAAPPAARQQGASLPVSAPLPDSEKTDFQSKDTRL